MMEMRFNPVAKLEGEAKPPGDKSISHRAALIGGISRGVTRAVNFLVAEDTMRTLECMGKLGVSWSLEDNVLNIEGRGFDYLREPDDVLDVGNSGTTIRLITGILASSPFLSVITGDRSIRSRPMRRVVEPLRSMGATILGREDGDKAPLAIRGGKLKGINYEMTVPSAQVKSAIALAGLNAEGPTTIRGDQGSRDHTERMLLYLGGDLKVSRQEITVNPSSLEAGTIYIPGDFSSASFILAAALLLPNSSVILKEVGLNPTRAGFLSVINSMGGMVMEESLEELSNEPRGNLLVKNARLSGVEVEGWRIPSLIDELPLLAVIGTQSEGETVVRGAVELRVKESDRIKAIVSQLRKMGGSIQELEDGFIARGPVKLKGTKVSSFGDHRIAMSLAVAALCAEGETVIEGWECVDISFPGFVDCLKRLIR